MIADVRRDRNLCILGLGLVGGSLGLAARRHGLVDRVVGYDQDPQAAKRASERGAVTDLSSTPEAAVGGADLVVIATPVGAIAEVFRRIAPGLSPGAVVTDVGSTKSALVAGIASSGVPEGVHFIGGHPMAGSEREGVDAASGDLFDGCLWILTPTESTPPEAYGRLMRFLSALGTRVISLDPERHDAALALTSHLPQLLSSTLMGFAADVAADGDGLPLLAAGGFRDMTRIAGSSPDLWVDIVRQNRDALAGLLRRFLQALGDAADSLESGDWEALRYLLADARQARRTLPGKPGLSAGELLEMLIPVPDRPGVLAEVTTTLTTAGVNIEDLDIVHSAEGGRGVIRIAVNGTGTALRAAEALQAKGYQTEQAG